MPKPKKSTTRPQNMPDNDAGPKHEHSPDDSPKYAVESGEPTITGKSSIKGRDPQQDKRKQSPDR
jgi:hypothetical protein